MASSSSSSNQLYDIAIEDETKGGLDLQEWDTRGEEEFVFDWRLCLLGGFITAGTVDFPSMQLTLAALWKPGKGVYIKELDANRFLFQFFHEIDFKRVIEGSPWYFNRKALIISRMKNSSNPRCITLDTVDLWVLIHDLQTGCMTSTILQAGISDMAIDRGKKHMSGKEIDGGNSELSNSLQDVIQELSLLDRARTSNKKLVGGNTPYEPKLLRVHAEQIRRQISPFPRSLIGMGKVFVNGLNNAVKYGIRHLKPFSLLLLRSKNSVPPLIFNMLFRRTMIRSSLKSLPFLEKTTTPRILFNVLPMKIARVPITSAPEITLACRRDFELSVDTPAATPSNTPTTDITPVIIPAAEFTPAATSAENSPTAAKSPAATTVATSPAAKIVAQSTKPALTNVPFSQSLSGEWIRKLNLRGTKIENGRFAVHRGSWLFGVDDSYFLMAISGRRCFLDLWLPLKRIILFKRTEQYTTKAGRETNRQQREKEKATNY
ncbi:hypothetical protein G4B88_026455 [Cannabis sativa]|uniref:DUF4283 domain-containing protein n=1 Tax=Cannabis sativa TaxID=3483 RepID=A0A7J6GWQ4_CANSA|nr:hypothetical protein G4B88_026455 [Cannabis sativa]